MRPLSPIRTLVLLSGSAGVLELFPTPTGYDPASSSDYVPPTPVDLPVKGVYSTAHIAGIDVMHDALYLIDTIDMPAGLLPEKSHCTVVGETFVVMSVQDRWYVGERDGLTLHLKVPSDG